MRFVEKLQLVYGINQNIYIYIYIFTFQMCFGFLKHWETLDIKASKEKEKVFIELSFQKLKF